MTDSTRSFPKHVGKTYDADGYTVIKHTYIPMRDGTELCADVFLPTTAIQQGRKVPVICSLGPYGKDVPVLEFGLPKTPIYMEMYKNIKPLGPHASFELLDPMVWSKDYGYALLRVDARGVCGSQGRLDPFGIQRSAEIGGDSEGQDLYDVVEWAGTQAWSNGKVATSGISYIGMIGYTTAEQKPPHLAAVVCYEASADGYQTIRRGGVGGENFQAHWYNNIVIPYQAGNADGRLDASQLAANRTDWVEFCRDNEYPDTHLWKIIKQRKLSDIEVPLYTAGNWTDSEVHLPGNILSFNQSSSKFKWLEMHTGNHLASYYDPEHVALQKKFLDYFLFGREDSGILEVPRIRLQQHRAAGHFFREQETAFPPPDAEDISFYLTPGKKLSLSTPGGAKQALSYEGLTGTMSFELEHRYMEPFELIGVPFVDLELSTDAEDADVFLCLRALDANGKPILLEGNHGETNEQFAKGYFRLSHREEVEAGFNKDNPIPVQPVTPRSKVEKGKVYSVRIPFYPAVFYFDAGQTLSLEIGAQDTLSTIPPMRHDGGDRVPQRFGGRNTIFSHGRLVLPQVRRPAPLTAHK